jgi:hypothetical protein
MKDLTRFAKKRMEKMDSQKKKDGKDRSRTSIDPTMMDGHGGLNIGITVSGATSWTGVLTIELRRSLLPRYVDLVAERGEDRERQGASASTSSPLGLGGRAAGRARPQSWRTGTTGDRTEIFIFFPFLLLFYIFTYSHLRKLLRFLSRHPSRWVPLVRKAVN